VIANYIKKKSSFNKFQSIRIFGNIARLNNLSKKLTVIGASIYPYRSTIDIENLIGKYAPDLLSEKVFYIEAGANNGIDASNTFFLESIYGAKGILIEPSASLFEQCRCNRNSSNIFELCALGNPKKNDEYLTFIYSNLMTVSTKIDIFDPKNHAFNGQKFIDIEPYEFLAPLKSLESILKKYNRKSVDFLSLDLEGGEMEALMGANLMNLQYKYILVETRNKKEMESFMIKNGYKLIIDVSPIDLFFKRIT